MHFIFRYFGSLRSSNNYQNDPKGSPNLVSVCLGSCFLPDFVRETEGEARLISEGSASTQKPWRPKHSTPKKRFYPGKYWESRKKSYCCSVTTSSAPLKGTQATIMRTRAKQWGFLTLWPLFYHGTSWGPGYPGKVSS